MKGSSVRRILAFDSCTRDLLAIIKLVAAHCACKLAILLIGSSMCCDSYTRSTHLSGSSAIRAASW